MSIVDDAKEIKDWINDDDPCDTGDLEPYIVLQMCNYILRKKKAAKPLQSWQITEDRYRAIQWAEEMAGDCKVGDVLHTMLQEAGQE